MPRRTFPGAAKLALAGFLTLAALASTARAQIPRPPVMPPTGVTFRHVPIVPKLPPDPKRDQFFDTRWADNPPSTKHVNNPLDGGLYGRRYRSDCTSCVSPYFRGRAGDGKLCLDCAPGPKGSRLLGNFVHPFRPVGSYYAGGCYVPIYDLDPVVTGPGPFPWPHFFKWPIGG